MEVKTLAEGINETLEMMANGDLNKPIRGEIMVIGTTKEEHFKKAKEEMASENVLFLESIEIKVLEKILLSEKEEVFVLEYIMAETLEEVAEQTYTYRSLARQYNKNIILHICLNESLDNVEIGRSFFKNKGAIEQDPSAIVVINSFGKVACKNRYGYENEPNLKEIFHI